MHMLPATSYPLPAANLPITTKLPGFDAGRGGRLESSFRKFNTSLISFQERDGIFIIQ